MKNDRPIIEVSHVLMARRSYTLSEDAAGLLEEYANFLCDFTKSRVSPGDIISRLVDRLRRDDLFIKWRISRDKKEAAPNQQTKHLQQGEKPHV